MAQRGVGELTAALGAHGVQVQGLGRVPVASAEVGAVFSFCPR